MQTAALLIDTGLGSELGAVPRGRAKNQLLKSHMDDQQILIHGLLLKHPPIKLPGLKDGMIKDKPVSIFNLIRSSPLKSYFEIICLG